MLMWSFLLSAQTLSVTDFRLLENDLTANTYGSMERDQNGEVAALIKVVTPETGFVFDGGMLGVVKTVQKTGEVWVYVPFGLQRITISHQRLGVLRDYYFPVPIEKARTYEMKLLAGVVRTVREDNTTAQFVTFNVDPNTAIVSIDDIPYSLNPEGAMMQLLANGPHSYRVDAPGYFPQDGEFQVAGDSVTVNVKLKSMAGIVHLECAMENAELYVNNRFVGTGSWTGSCAPALYNVEARLKGHRPGTVSFALQVQEERTINVPAPQPVYGDISINSTPDAATVFVDGKEVGTTPYRSTLLSGSHSIELQKQDFKTYNTTVDIKEGETSQVNATLVDRHMLTIHTKPEYATLYINGVNVGITPYSTEMASGDYDIRLVKSGYNPYHKKKVHLDPMRKELTFKLSKEKLKDIQLYVNGFYRHGGMDVIGGSIGSYIMKFNSEIEYSRPLQKTHVYQISTDPANTAKTTEYTYDKMWSLSGMIGMGFIILHRFRVTPQVGISYCTITETAAKEYYYSLDEVHQHHLVDAVGAIRFEWTPIEHLSIFVTPTYIVPYKQNPDVRLINENTHLIDDWDRGRIIKGGLSFYF